MRQSLGTIPPYATAAEAEEHPPHTEDVGATPWDSFVRVKFKNGSNKKIVDGSYTLRIRVDGQLPVGTVSSTSTFCVDSLDAT